MKFTNYHYILFSFRNFCDHDPFLQKKKWKQIDRKHTNQNDDFNCGVFVCLFFEKIFQNEKLLFNCSPQKLKQKRLEMNFLLKSNSGTMFCSICGCNIKISDDAIKFDCNHKFHEECKKNIDFRKDCCLICSNVSNKS